MSERTEKIAELYYRSNTVKFGAFTLSIHKDHPDLPLSPWYLHYPKEGEPGSELLPELYSLIGEEFYAMSETQNPPIRPTRVTGLPKGAVGLADAYAKQYEEYPSNLLKFAKIQHDDGKTEYGYPEGEFKHGELLQPCEDHISGGRNNLLFLAHVRKLGFLVKHLLAVVDRQQGGMANMASKGVELLAIFTGDKLLEYGVAENHIAPVIFEEVQEYRTQNQYSFSGPK